MVKLNNGGGFWHKTECPKVGQYMPLSKNSVISDRHDHYFAKNLNFKFKDMDLTDIETHKLNYHDLELDDNSAKKEIKRKKLKTVEDNRYAKELTKNKLTKNSKSSRLKPLKIKHKEFKEKNKIKVEEVDLLVRTRILKLEPDSDQLETIVMWIKYCDIGYNYLVVEFKNHLKRIQERNPNINNKLLVKKIRENPKFPINFKKLRKLVIKKCRKNNKTPFCVMANMIKGFVAGIKGNLEKLSQDPDFVFEMKKRYLFRKMRSISIDVNDVGIDGPYSRSLGSLKIRNTRHQNGERIKVFNWSDVKKDFKIVYHKYSKRLELHAPILVKRQFPEKENKMVSLDPGEINFLTGYGVTNSFIIGKNIQNNIKRHYKTIDKVKKKMKKKKWRKWKYKRVITRHQIKIRNKIKELHNKSNNFLCKNYERIMISDFGSKPIPKMNPSTKRVLNSYSHAQLRKRLQDKCKEYSSQLNIVNESYTSVTCGLCGFQNHPKGRKYSCSKCGMEEHRDINGARNILIKNRVLVLK